MAVLKRIANKQGNGAGRAPYALEKAVAVRTDVPSPLSLLLGDRELPAELKRELAEEFNRHLLIHQGSCKTQHFVISFSHHLSPKQIEKLLDRIESIFSDPFRYHLYAVHQEDHGTAVHVIESADPDGKLRHLSQKEFYDLKRTVIRELRPFMNAREREVARNFQRGTPTQDWKHQVELHAPKRSFKEYVRQTVLKASELIRQGDVDKALELLTSKGVEITEKKAGELSPSGRVLRRDRTYAVLNHPVFGQIAVRLDKKMRATFRLYLSALEEIESELRKAEETLREFQGSYRETPGAGEQKTSVRGRAPGEREKTSGSHLSLQSISEKTPEGRNGAPENHVNLQQPFKRTPEPKEPETGIPELHSETSGTLAGAPGPAGRTGESGKQTQIPERPALNRDSHLKEPGKSAETGERELRPQHRRTERVPQEMESPTHSIRSSNAEPDRERTPLHGREKLPDGAPELDAEPYRSAETAEPLPPERSNSGSSEKLGNIHRQPEQPVLPPRTQDLPGLLQHKRQVEVSNQALRNVHTSEPQTEKLSILRRDPSKVIVVESLSDAKAISRYKKFKDHTLLILNGSENLSRAVKILKRLSPEKLYVATSLDEKGIEVRRKLKRAFPNALQIYFYGKDPAEHLKHEGALPPAPEDSLTSLGDMQVVENFMLGGYLTEGLLLELSPNLYELFLDYLDLEEASKLAEEEINRLEREEEPDRDVDDDWDYGPGR